MDLELHEMDVKIDFLNEELNEEIYMEQPVSFIVQGQEHKVWKLNWLIYDLKQSSKQWYLRFRCAITSYVFTMIDEDHYVYVKINKNKHTLLSLYMDDILIVGNDFELVRTI